MRYIHFDAQKCVGCHNCQLVCSGTWQRVFNTQKANLRIDWTGWYGPFAARVCRQEADAPCAKACPTEALWVDDQKGLVAFEAKKCDGCQVCLSACPHDAIFVHPDYPLIFKCDLCRGGQVQHCVESCPRGALRVKAVCE